MRSYSYSNDTPSEARLPHLPLGHVLLNNHSMFYGMGLRDPLTQRLGKGAFGAAYQIPAAGGTVLKLTRDVSEVQAAHLLRGRDSKRIVHVYGVWAVEGTIIDDLTGWFAIHRGLLNPLNEKDTALVEAIFQVFGDEDLDLTIPRSLKQHAMIQKWRHYLRMELDIDGEEEAAMSAGVARDVKKAVMLLLQIGEAVDEMHKVGIDWEDIHPDNIMRTDRGRLVVADFGFGLMHEKFDEKIPDLSHEVVGAHIAPLLAL